MQIKKRKKDQTSTNHKLDQCHDLTRNQEQAKSSDRSQPSSTPYKAKWRETNKWAKSGTPLQSFKPFFIHTLPPVPPFSIRLYYISGFTTHLPETFWFSDSFLNHRMGNIFFYNFYPQLNERRAIIFATKNLQTNNQESDSPWIIPIRIHRLSLFLRSMPPRFQVQSWTLSWSKKNTP